MTRFRTWLRDIPLLTKLILLTTLMVITSTGIVTGVSIVRERANFRAALQSEAELLLETLPLTLRDPLYLIEVDEIADVAGVISDEPDITVVRVFDRRGVPLVDTNRGGTFITTAVDPVGADLVRQAPDAINIQWEADELLAGRAVWLGNEPIGAVQIGLSTAALGTQIVRLTGQNVLIALGSLALAVTLTVFVTRTIATPITELRTVAQDMAGGNYERRARLARRDEIGQLGDSFDQMAAAIQKRDQDLRELNAGLEQKVAERTDELRRQNEELEKARQRAEDATRLKSEFLASMSHELRTPLNAITGFSQLLLAGTSGELNEKQNERMQRILANSNTLLQLINDLLDLSKIEAGRLEIVPAPFSVKEWSDGIKLQLEGLAQQKKIDFKINIDDRLPKVIEADSVRLKQIVTNLVSNAIKFTSEGSVTVNVNRHSDTTWSIVVSDTGIGIPSHALEYIFDEFRQVDGTWKREQGGTGLGLSIVRKLVVTMGGTIRVESKVNEGSTFTAILPLSEYQPEKANDTTK